MACTKKTQNFPTIYKKCLKLEDVAGIDKVTACRLKESGICTVKALKQKAMCMGKCDFIKWMQCQHGANSYHAELTFCCLQQQICGEEENQCCKPKKQNQCCPPPKQQNQCCPPPKQQNKCCKPPKQQNPCCPPPKQQNQCCEEAESEEEQCC